VDGQAPPTGSVLEYRLALLRKRAKNERLSALAGRFPAALPHRGGQRCKAGRTRHDLPPPDFAQRRRAR
jgi:hypothetical protein